MVLEPANDCLDKSFLLVSHPIACVPDRGAIVVKKQVDEDAVLIHGGKPFLPLRKNPLVDSFLRIGINKRILRLIIACITSMGADDFHIDAIAAMLHELLNQAHLIARPRAIRISPPAIEKVFWTAGPTDEDM